MSERYTIAWDCGHRTIYNAERSYSGLAYCPICRNYVGVIVLRTDRPDAPFMADVPSEDGGQTYDDAVQA